MNISRVGGLIKASKKGKIKEREYERMNKDCVGASNMGVYMKQKKKESTNAKTASELVIWGYTYMKQKELIWYK